MKSLTNYLDRRKFIKNSALVSTAFMGISGVRPFGPTTNSGNDLYMIGPIEGYSPHIGTLVSMLNYNRQTIINTVKSLTMEELDYLHDPGANTIGALPGGGLGGGPGCGRIGGAATVCATNRTMHRRRRKCRMMSTLLHSRHGVQGFGNLHDQEPS